MTAALAPAGATRSLHESTVLVTPRSFGAHDPSLRAELEAEVGCVRYTPGPLRGDALVHALDGADAYIAGLDEVTEDVLARAPRLRVIARYGVGVDRIDLVAARRRGIVVTTTPDANANAVAELTIAFLLALARPIVEGHERAARGEWPVLAGREIAGRTLGVLGLGRIGSLVAAKARALGMHVLAHDPFRTGPADVHLVQLDPLLAESDYVSLHLPLSDATTHCVDAAFLARMKEGAALINTARGALVDDDALVRALDEGRLRAAAFDGLAVEPPRVDAPLLRRADVIVTPHIGPHTAEATAAMGRGAVDEVLAVLAGLPARHPVPA
jgi:phosphoglycerate dehydrogenase-like enzyme